MILMVSPLVIFLEDLLWLLGESEYVLYKPRIMVSVRVLSGRNRTTLHNYLNSELEIICL